MKPRLLSAAAASAVLACLPGAQALAGGAPEEDIFAGLEPVSEEVLASSRGGLNYGKFKINVGYSVTTSINSAYNAITVVTNYQVDGGGKLQNLGTQLAIKDAGQDARAAAENQRKMADRTREQAEAYGRAAQDAAEKLRQSFDKGLKDFDLDQPRNHPERDGSLNQRDALAKKNPIQPTIVQSPPSGSASEPQQIESPPPQNNNLKPFDPGSIGDIAPKDKEDALDFAKSLGGSSDLSGKGKAELASVAGDEAKKIIQITPKTNSKPSNQTPQTPTQQNDSPQKVTRPNDVRGNSAVSDTIEPVFAAAIDEEAGIVSVSDGVGTNLLLDTSNGHLALVENTSNNVSIEHKFSAQYVIENYHDIAVGTRLASQMSNIAQQMIVMNSLGRR